MSEQPEDPVGHAGSKIMQYASLATMAAEALAQISQNRAAAAAAADTRVAAALRAEHTGRRTAARLAWTPMLEATADRPVDLATAGTAWAASQPWAGHDPEAGLAATRSLDRMRELRPDALDRFDRLTDTGLDPIQAMARIAPFLDGPALDAPALEGTGLQTDAAVAARAADSERGRYATETAVPDDVRTPHLDEHSQAHTDAAPHLAEAAGQDTRAAALTALAEAASPAGGPGRTPPQMLTDGYPEPFTGEVLAGPRPRPRPTVTAGTTAAATQVGPARPGRRW